MELSRALRTLVAGRAGFRGIARDGFVEPREVSQRADCLLGMSRNRLRRCRCSYNLACPLQATTVDFRKAARVRWHRRGSRLRRLSSEQCSGAASLVDKDASDVPRESGSVRIYLDSRFSSRSPPSEGHGLYLPDAEPRAQMKRCTANGRAVEAGGGRD